MNPCWVWKSADLSKGARLTARIGETPFNFQLAESVSQVVWPKAATKQGELEIRLDDCVTGEAIKVIPLPAGGVDDFVTLTAELQPLSGRHDLCFALTAPERSAQRAIDRVRLSPIKARKP